IQETALALMGEKEAASQALEGTFDTNALRAMMNGGENDDILAALATTLEAGKKIDARAAWNAPKPSKKPKSPIIRPEPRAWQQGFLFDMDFTPAALVASGE
ncbi:MAG: hypothetical protein WCT04_24820, partial [Planctomycetota bacterium]